MNIFIWERLDIVSGSYHPEGDLTVIAKNLERAREIIKEKIDTDYLGKSKECDALQKAPKHQFELSGDVGELLIVHPNAGCC